MWTMLARTTVERLPPGMPCGGGDITGVGLGVGVGVGKGVLVGVGRGGVAVGVGTAVGGGVGVAVGAGVGVAVGTWVGVGMSVGVGVGSGDEHATINIVNITSGKSPIIADLRSNTMKAFRFNLSLPSHQPSSHHHQ